MDWQRSGRAHQGERGQPAAEAADAELKPLWLIALPTFACTVALASYLLLMIASRLI